jgi:LmbE family N-acetylglucosaminyl deacetylase
VTDPPRFLDYRDQELADADFEEAVGRVVSEMDRVTPDVVLTFGPSASPDTPTTSLPTG